MARCVYVLCKNYVVKRVEHSRHASTRSNSHDLFFVFLHIDVRIIEHSDTPIAVRMIERSDDGGSDNRGSTVLANYVKARSGYPTILIIIKIRGVCFNGTSDYNN